MQIRTEAGHRFDGISALYERTRPQPSRQLLRLILNYLEREPELVVDLGCGPGTSTLPWCESARMVTGIELNAEMYAAAAAKSGPGLSFRQRDARDTGLPAASADLVICQQSFHWMEPQSTLREVGRILRSGGVFAAVDYDWPPVCSWQVEEKYGALLQLAARLEREAGNPRPQRWEKTTHLDEMKRSGLFCFVRELTSAAAESCSRQRLYEMALSQSGVQAALRWAPDTMQAALAEFSRTVEEHLPAQFEITFCYRIRLGVRGCGQAAGA